MTTTAWIEHPALPPAEEVVRVTWRGDLTGDTANTIAAYLRARFEGPDKRFAVVTCDEVYSFRPKVRTGQRLRRPIEVAVRDEDGFFCVDILWHDTYGTIHRFRSNVREGRWVTEGVDPTDAGREIRGPHFSFEQSDGRQYQVSVSGLSETGQMHQTLIVEEESDSLVFDQ